jgi:hypothetical protein
MSTRLWDFYDGEPWMDNPQLGLLTMNKPRKRGKKMATRRKTRKRRKMSALQRMYFGKGRKRAAPRKRHASRRRKSYRKNWLSPGAVVAANPHRRRSRRRARVHHRRRHSYRRNPALLGFGIPGVKTVAFTAVGFVGPSFVVSLANQFVPSVVQSTTSMGVAGKYILKVGSILGLAWLTRRFVGANESNMVILGGSVNVGLTLINDFAPGWLPANPLAMYQPVHPGLRAVNGMGAYTPVRKGLRALVPNKLTAARGFIPSAAAQGDQGQYGTPSRYFRY